MNSAPRILLAFAKALCSGESAKFRKDSTCVVRQPTDGAGCPQMGVKSGGMIHPD